MLNSLTSEWPKIRRYNTERTVELEPKPFRDNIESVITDYSSQGVPSWFSSSISTNAGRTDNYTYGIDNSFWASSSNSSTDNDYSDTAALEKELPVFNRLMLETDFDDGQETPLERYLIDLAKKYKSAKFVMLIQKFWSICLRDESNRKVSYFIHSAETLCDYIDPDLLLTIPISALTRKNVLVRETALSLLENWDSQSHADVLKSTSDIGVSWLDQYKKDIIDYLERAR
jgi:hypothetical protein